MMTLFALKTTRHMVEQGTFDAEHRRTVYYEEILTKERLLARYPRIIATLIVLSDGYLTAHKAALLLWCANTGRSLNCEWIDHVVRCQQSRTRAEYEQGYWGHPKYEQWMIEQTREQVQHVLKHHIWFRFGRPHDYRRARALVDRAQQGLDRDALAGWF